MGKLSLKEMKELVQGILKTGFKPSRLASEPKYPAATHASFYRRELMMMKVAQQCGILEGL